MSTEPIYLILRKRNGEPVGHTVSFSRPTPETLENLWHSKDNPAPETKQAHAPVEEPSFASALQSFISIMTTYRNMIPFTIEMSPLVSGTMAAREIRAFAAGHGTEIVELTSENWTVLEIGAGHLGALLQRHEAAMAAVKGAEHLPEIAVIGLVSVYDAYLARLLRVIFNYHKEMILTSDRDLKYSDLLKFHSIEDAIQNLIDKEVESVLRMSHHDQFSWMEKKFSMKLRDNLDVWPQFIEICERRNLLTHTGGVVSNQYIQNCSGAKDNANKIVGNKLTTDAIYFKDAVRIISEVGFKLGHVLWRKFKEDEREDADTELNLLALNLITNREYQVSRRILELGVNFKKHSSDVLRRMMIVNLANAVRLGGDKAEAANILAREDWSATRDNFQICVAAVKEAVAEVCKLMIESGPNGPISADQYREWPVFRRIRTLPEFGEAFRKTFGEAVFKDEPPGDSEEVTDLPAPSTLH